MTTKYIYINTILNGSEHMKKVSYYAISIFLIVFLINSAYGFPGMAGNTTVKTENITQTGIDLINATQSDQDIQMIQHLIEIDAVRSVNGIYVRETLIFKNTGDKNFSGTLRTWVMDGAENPRIGKTEMMVESQPVPVEFRSNGNIISWNDSIMPNDPLLPLYIVDYFIPSEANGALGETKYYSKKLAYPTLINYEYGQRTDLPAIVLKVTKSNDSSVKLRDENGNEIPAQDVAEEGNSIVYRFSSPQFKELNVEISKTAVSSMGNYAGYVILGVLIILILSYPMMRKKSERLQAFENRIRNSLKSKQPEETAVEDEVEEAVEEEPMESGEEELSGKTIDELEVEKSELVSKLDELEKDYSSGNMLDEEYEELKSSYRSKLEKVNKRLKQPDN